MLLRLVVIRNKKYVYCSNGSVLECTPNVLQDILVKFDSPQKFKGNSGYWNIKHADMEDVEGITLAYIDESKRLIVINPTAFKDCLKTATYISATEFATKHNKGVAIVKRLCSEGRIEGAYKTSSGWLIPTDAKYPKRKTRNSNAK